MVMKYFPMSPAVWLISVNLAYLVVGLINLFVYNFTHTEVIQMAWILVLMLPVWCPMKRIVKDSPLILN